MQVTQACPEHDAHAGGERGPRIQFLESREPSSAGRFGLGVVAAQGLELGDLRVDEDEVLDVPGGIGIDLDPGERPTGFLYPPGTVVMDPEPPPQADTPGGGQDLAFQERLENPDPARVVAALLRGGAGLIGEREKASGVRLAAET